MKKHLALVLAALLLSGCTTQPPEPTAAVTEPTVAPTEEAIISYNSVEALEFDYEDVFSAAPMGDDLLLMCGMDQTTLIKISGRNHKQTAVFSAETSVYPGGPGVRISENGVCYTIENEYVFLDENLEEVERVTLPGAWGRGAVTADLQTIYYSTGSQLRSYSRQTGLDRLLRDTTHSAVALESLELDGSVLACSLLDHSAVSASLFYSAATGELLGTYECSLSLTSAGDLWLAKTSDGRRNQIVIGGSVESQVLTGWESFSDVTVVSGGALVKTHANGTPAIRFLNLPDHTEALMDLNEDASITNAWSAGGILWVALDDGRLLRWELEALQAQDAACLGPYYSRENPDTEGLAALELTAQALESTYGVEIHMVEDEFSDDISAISEYQVEPLEAGLSSLSAALGRFSPTFLEAVSASSEDGKIHIALVRSFTGAGCIQFWDREGSAWIVLPLGDTAERDFYHGLAHLIDARVMTKTTSYDSWKRLNPKGFDYDYDYASNAVRDGSAYADAFIDTFAMSFPVEDRARVFEYAMLADSGGHFQSDTMQSKLSALCAGIRKAFKLSDTDILPWEQYLNQ